MYVKSECPILLSHLSSETLHVCFLNCLLPNEIAASKTSYPLSAEINIP